MQRYLTTRSSKSSGDAVLPASLPERRSVWRSSPPCWTEPHAASLQISLIRRELNQLYLIVHAVEGLESGAYVFHRDHGVLESLKLGNLRAQAGHLGLDQELAADAAVDIFFLAELRPILQRFGNRGYRAVQLEAGILGGKMYLAAYAQHLGATGLTTTR
jgi:hypothetical protein